MIRFFEKIDGRYVPSATTQRVGTILAWLVLIAGLGGFAVLWFTGWPLVALLVPILVWFLLFALDGLTEETDTRKALPVASVFIRESLQRTSSDDFKVAIFPCIKIVSVPMSVTDQRRWKRSNASLEWEKQENNKRF